MAKYPDYETYRALYARYHNRVVADILQLLEPLEGARVVDLCGGDGRLTSEALVHGAQSVLLVDSEATMIPSLLRGDERITVLIEEVHCLLAGAYQVRATYDRVVCQQAVNYWLDEETAWLIAEILTPGGRFVFNTFNRQPTEKPRVLQYELDGHAFVEVSWLAGVDVHHLQIRDGMLPHHTVFRWLSPERLREMLEPHFIVYEDRREKTSLYRCEKR